MALAEVPHFREGAYWRSTDEEEIDSSCPKYAATLSCVLCGDKFATTPEDRGDFLAVIEQGQSEATFTEEGSIPPQGGEVRVSISTASSPPYRQQDVYICRDTRPQQAYCLHVYCGQSLRKSYKAFTARQLLRFARSTAAIFRSPSEFDAEWMISCTGLGNPSLELSDLSDFTSLLRNMRGRLPIEITIAILHQVGPCQPRRLLRLEAGDIQYLVERVATQPYAERQSIGAGQSVVANMITIRGSSYLCGFRTNTKQLGYSVKTRSQCRIQIPMRIIGIKIALSSFGIRGLQILGEQETSEWIGEILREPHELWITVIRAQAAAACISLSWDELKLHQVSLDGRPSSFGDQFFWDHDPLPSIQNSLNPDTLYAAEDSYISPSTSTGFANIRFMRYLSFVEKDYHLFALTVFCSRYGGVSGFKGHFRNNNTPAKTFSRCKGRCQELPIHFRMRPTEFIITVWVRRRSEIFCSPFLVVETNLGRSCTFGPAIDSPTSRYILLATRRHGTITGLYYDAFRPNMDNIISFGLTCENPRPSDQYEPRPPISRLSPSSYPHLQASHETLFKSEAHLSDVRAITVTTTGPRCTAMIVSYENFSEATLGRWDEDSEFSSYQVYTKMTDYDFQDVHFKLFVDGETVTICQIKIGRNRAGGICEHMRHKELVAAKDTKLTWWFSLFSDAIYVEPSTKTAITHV